MWYNKLRLYHGELLDAFFSPDDFGDEGFFIIDDPFIKSDRERLKKDEILQNLRSYIEQSRVNLIETDWARL